MINTNLPDPGRVLDLIEAFRRSRTMFTAVELGVFDRLAAGPAEAAEIRNSNEDPVAFEGFLNACVSLGLLEKRDGKYANTPAADAYLRSDSPHTLNGYIEYSNDILWQLWAHLADGVREGTHRWKQAFGLEGPLFSAYYSSDDRKRKFLLGMHGFGMLSSPAVAAAFDLGRFRRVVDLGGATGHLPQAILDRYPHMEGAVFDLPQVIDFAREFTAGTRVELIAGDFFTDPLPHGDLYSLGRILHDWSDDKIRALLARIRAALPPGGGLLIAERLLHDDKLGPVSTHMQSLNMLVATEGRERSVQEYAALVREAGFEKIESKFTGQPLDALLCT